MARYLALRVPSPLFLWQRQELRTAQSASPCDRQSSFGGRLTLGLSAAAQGTLFGHFIHDPRALQVYVRRQVLCFQYPGILRRCATATTSNVSAETR